MAIREYTSTTRQRVCLKVTYSLACASCWYSIRDFNIDAALVPQPIRCHLFDEIDDVGHPPQDEFVADPGNPEVSELVAVLVGGTPLTGGVGGVVNTLIGTLIVAVIRSSMLYFEIDATQQQMVFGLVLIAAIALTIDRSKMRIVK